VGRYYGKHGFDSLSRAKSIVLSPIDMRIDAVLPPYTKEKAVELSECLPLLPFGRHQKIEHSESIIPGRRSEAFSNPQTPSADFPIENRTMLPKPVVLAAR
jgi:hypothetical protein